jgi:purine catabolism regulator
MSAPRPTPPVAPFLLADVLEHHELQLELLTGPAETRSRRVSGVHSIEIEHPARWLAPDWVMLTTGVRLKGRPQEQRALIAELDERGVTALGFARDIVFKEVPPTLLDAARERAFPVFAVPLETPFREIVTFVHGSLVSSEMRALQRLSSMQRYLIDALHAPDPRTTVVERLATVLDASVAILGPHGEVEQAVGGLPAGLDEVLGDPASGPREVQRGAWHLVATPVTPDGAPEGGHRWIVAASRSSTLVSRVTRPAVAAAAPLVAAIGRLEDAVRRQDRAVRSALLEELLRPEDRDPKVLSARAATLGLDLDGPHQVVVVAWTDGAPPSDAERRRAVRALEQRLAPAEAQCLSCVERASLILLLPRVDGRAEAALRAALEDDPAIVCGIGRVFRGVTGVAESYADAHVAYELAVGRGTRLQRYDELDLPTLLVGQVPVERIAPVLEQVLGVLHARPSLREALEAYFAHHLDVTAAAEALHLHPNSLRYRLARLSDALGRPIRAPETITTLHLALEMERRLDAIDQR